MFGPEFSSRPLENAALSGWRVLTGSSIVFVTFLCTGSKTIWKFSKFIWNFDLFKLENFELWSLNRKCRLWGSVQRQQIGVRRGMYRLYTEDYIPVLSCTKLFPGMFPGYVDRCEKPIWPVQNRGKMTQSTKIFYAIIMHNSSTLAVVRTASLSVFATG